RGKRSRDRPAGGGGDFERVDRLAVEQPQLEPVVAEVLHGLDRALERPPGRSKVRERDAHHWPRSFASSAAYASRSTGSDTARPSCVERTIAFATSSDQSASRAGTRGSRPSLIAATKSACTPRWSPR